MSGTPNQYTSYNGILDFPIKDQLKFYDAWGSANTYPHMAVAWSWAFDTPFKWTKQIASHFGGTRQGMAISWPNRIKDAGGIRSQFHHIIDIVPTILEATGVRAPQPRLGQSRHVMDHIAEGRGFDEKNVGHIGALRFIYRPLSMAAITMATQPRPKRSFTAAR